MDQEYVETIICEFQQYLNEVGEEEEKIEVPVRFLGPSQRLLLSGLKHPEASIQGCSRVSSVFQGEEKATPIYEKNGMETTREAQACASLNQSLCISVDLLIDK